MNLGSILSLSRVPLSTFSCRFYQLRWWSPAEVHWTVHVDCPRAKVGVLGVPQGTKGELGAAFWHELPKMSGFVHVDSLRGQSNGPRLATTT